jgi:hypothetical protein
MRYIGKEKFANRLSSNSKLFLHKSELFLFLSYHKYNFRMLLYLFCYKRHCCSHNHHHTLSTDFQKLYMMKLGLNNHIGCNHIVYKYNSLVDLLLGTIRKEYCQNNSLLRY